MLSINQTFRVFISSTFSDLKAERDALQSFVFPKLRELCRLHGAKFQAIDLRWGVSDEAAHEQQTMNICLEEIARCRRTTPRPNFVILLGDRYGWRPVPDEIPNCYFGKICDQLKEQARADELAVLYKRYECDNNALPPVRWLKPRNEKSRDPEVWEKIEQALLAIFQEACVGLSLDAAEILKFGASATEQEITHGVLLKEGAPKDVHTFLRSIRNLEPGTRAEAFQDREVSAGLRLKRLKEQLRRCLPQTNIHEYLVDWTGEGITTDHLGPVVDEPEGSAPSVQSTTALRTPRPNFCQDFYDSLANIIRDELKPVKADLRDQEIKYHTDFGRNRADEELFTGRTETLEKIGAYLRAGNAAPLAVCGVSGSGKSTVMARAVAAAQAGHPQAEIIFRFIGVTPESTQPRALLESLCRQISSRYGMERPVPTEYLKLSQDFSARLEEIPADKPLYLFLDALDQLSGLKNARSLNWLPIGFPAQVRLVVSTSLDSPCFAVLESQLPNDHLLRLSEMPDHEGRDLFTKLLSQAKRTLQPPQRDKVLKGFKHSPLPLYLKLAFEEARRWRSGDVPRDLENDIPGLIRGLFERLSQPANHGRLLVSASLGFLAAAKNGLTEDELIDLIAEDTSVLEDFRRRFPNSPKADRLPVVIWSRLFYDLENYLSERGADGTSLLAFFHRQFNEAVAKAYLDEATALRRHHALAKYFAQQQLQFDSAGRRILNLRKLSELPYQLRKARMPDELENTLCDLSFIEAKCAAGFIDDLLVDYDAALESGILREDRRARLADFARFVHAQSHLLATHPGLTFQQALNEPDSTAPAQAARDLARAGREARPRFRWVNKPQTVSPCVLRLVGHTDGVNNCDVSPDGKRVVSASSDKKLKVWDVATGRDLLTLRGHNVGAETCAFSPDGKRIISGDRNGEIKLWDAVSGNELLSFSGHHDAIMVCKFSHDGQRVVSSSWDKTVRIWNARTGSELHTLSGHPDEVYGCAFSPDDRRIVLGGDDGSLKLWDAVTGEELEPFDGHVKAVMSCAFSRDGQSVFSASEDGTLKRWEAATRELRNTYTGHETPVWCLAVSKDGTRLASGSDGGNLRLWDVETGAELAKMTGHTNQVWGVAFFPDGTRVVSAAWDWTLKVWDLRIAEQAEHASQQMPVESAKGKVASLGRPISACCCSPDGAYYAAGSADGSLKLWEAATGSTLGIFNPHQAWILTCKFSPDGRWILSGAWDGSLKLFDAAERREGPQIPRVEKMGKILDCAFSLDGKRLTSCSADRVQVWEKSTAGVLPQCTWRGEEGSPFRTCAMAPDGEWIIGGFEDGRLVIWDVALEAPAGSFAGHPGLRCCDLSPDGARLVSASSNGSLKIWDVATRSELKHLAVHGVRVDSCNFSPDGRRVVSSSWDHTVKVWDLERPGVEPVTLIGHTDTLQDARFSPDGKRILSAGMDGTVRLWDADTGTPLGYLLGPADSAIACAFSADHRRIVSACHRHALKLWDTGSGEVEHILRGHDDMVRACAFSPDGRQLVSASADCTLRLWEVASGRTLATLTGHRGPVMSCAFSPDGKQIASGAWDRTVRLWDAETGALLTTLPGHQGWVQLVLFSAEGMRIVSCAQDKTLKVWGTAGGELLSTLVGHQDLVGSCAFSPDGSRLVSGSGDGILKVWDVSAGSELLTLTGHAGGIRSCAFSPDGLQIVSASMDKTLKLWETSSGQPRCTLTGHEGWVLACAFSTDGKHVLSGSQDRLLKLWDSSNGREICEYWAGASVQSVSWHPTGRRLAAGDAIGQLHLLELEGSV